MPLPLHTSTCSAGHPHLPLLGWHASCRSSHASLAQSERQPGAPVCRQPPVCNTRASASSHVFHCRVRAERQCGAPVGGHPHLWRRRVWPAQGQRLAGGQVRGVCDAVMLVPIARPTPRCSWCRPCGKCQLTPAWPALRFRPPDTPHNRQHRIPPTTRMQGGGS